MTVLLDNALRYGAGPIEVTASTADGHVAIRVRDHGGGIDAQLLPVVFERFTRADTARGGSGTGLGLALVAAPAARFGGDVGAANPAEGGAEVWLRLPLTGDGDR